MKTLPFVSTVIPCFNEERFIAKCLDSITTNGNYPEDRLEILVVDGMSDDGTREIAKSYVSQYPYIRLVDNPRKTTSAALNIGVKRSKGEIIMIMSAHAIYGKDYITECVKCLEKYAVDNLGGIMITVPGDDSLISKAIALALSDRFGVGNSHFRIGVKEPKLVDTVPFGCYKRDVFERIGFFNIHLIRNQDIEFNLRLRRAGGKILLVPDIVSHYHARSSLRELSKQSFWNGFWVIYGSRFARIPFSWRHLVPFILVLSLVGTLCLSVFWKPFVYFSLMIVMTYSVANLLFSFGISLRHRLSLCLSLMICFFTLHFPYGLGSVWGIVRSLVPRRE